MTLDIKPYSEIVTDQVSSIQGAMPNIQFPVGSYELAAVQANAGVALWLQAINLQLLAATRASSSTGDALDSWMADFNFYRNPAQKASGSVTFQRSTNTTQAVVPIGGLVSSSIGNIQYIVVLDTTNPNYNPSLNGYVLAIGVSSIDVKVDAKVSGAAGNATPGAINTLSSSMPGIDSVTNSNAFTNGADKESDASFRARFINYINSLSQGTLLAYANAITNGTSVLFYNIVENTNFAGDPQPGFNTIIIDDGSGHPPQTLIDLIYANINSVRGVAINNGVYALVVLTVNIEVDITIDPSFDQATIISQIKASVGGYIANLQVAAPVIYTKLYQLIYSASTGILEASNLTINSGTTDVTPSFKERAFLGTFDVSVLG